MKTCPTCGQETEGRRIMVSESEDTMTGTQLYLSIAASGDSVMGTRVVEKLLYQIDHGQVSPRLAQRVTLKILCRALQSEQMSWQDFVSCLKAVS